MANPSVIRKASMTPARSGMYSRVREEYHRELSFVAHLRQADGDEGNYDLVKRHGHWSHPAQTQFAARSYPTFPRMGPSCV